MQVYYVWLPWIIATVANAPSIAPPTLLPSSKCFGRSVLMAEA